jgi:hypothetical protein
MSKRQNMFGVFVQGALTEGEGSVWLTSSLRYLVFIKKKFNIKCSISKLDSIRRLTVLSLHLQSVFPGLFPANIYKPRLNN